MPINSVDTFLDDVESFAKAPKWIGAFRDTYYKRNRLPFLLVYQASAIASKKDSRVYRDKSAAIAIATNTLQRSGCILEGTNTLSERGRLREIAVMSRLGKAKTKEYIKAFESL